MRDPSIQLHIHPLTMENRLGNKGLKTLFIHVAFAHPHWWEGEAMR